MDAIAANAARGRPDRRVWRGSATEGLDDPPPEVRILRDPERGAAGEELVVLRKTIAIGRASTDESAVVSEILELVGDALSSEHPMLFLYSPESDEMRSHSLAGGPRRLPLSEPSIIRRVLVSNRGEIVNDAAGDPDFNPRSTEGTELRQLVAAPLTTGRGRIGVIAAVNSQRGAFVDHELAMLTKLAATAAFLLENTQLHATVGRQTRELFALHRLAQLLATAETLDAAIAESQRIVSEMLDCAQSVVLMFDDASNNLVVCDGSESVTGGHESGGVSLETPSLAGTVFRTQTPLVSNDAQDDPWVGEALRGLIAIDNCLVLPITSGSQSIGVLVAANANKGAFATDDLHFSSMLGVRVGNVIEASRARERDRASLTELRESERNRTDFVSMLAHELKGPMTTIKGFAEILQKHSTELDDDKRTEYSTIIADEIDRLCDLVNDLLDIARMDNGTLHTEPRRTKVGEIVANLLLVHPSLSATHEVEVAVDDDLPDMLCDKNRIRQVVLNLLQNATRYSPEGGRVSLTADTVEERDRRFVRICVADEGIGIPAKDLERIFSKFVMLPKPGWAAKGTGLGLFISKGIVEAHGGRIWAESEGAGGSRLSFTLPALD
jgi:signal transduction histidine kinase